MDIKNSTQSFTPLQLEGLEELVSRDDSEIYITGIDGGLQIIKVQKCNKSQFLKIKGENVTLIQLITIANSYFLRRECSCCCIMHLKNSYVESTNVDDFIKKGGTIYFTMYDDKVCLYLLGEFDLFTIKTSLANAFEEVNLLLYKSTQQ